MSAQRRSRLSVKDVGPTMRNHLIVGVLLAAACASSPEGYCVPDVVGQYRMQDGPEIWLELEILPPGACIVASNRLVGSLMRTSSTGHWRIEEDAIVLDVDSDEFRLMVGTSRLALRRWDGHVYLVPPRDLSWFDQHGPLNEFCFSQEGAPLFSGPMTRRANSAQQPTSAPGGARGSAATDVGRSR